MILFGSLTRHLATVLLKPSHKKPQVKKGKKNLNVTPTLKLLTPKMLLDVGKQRHLSGTCSSLLSGDYRGIFMQALSWPPARINMDEMDAYNNTKLFYFPK